MRFVVEVALDTPGLGFELRTIVAPALTSDVLLAKMTPDIGAPRTNEVAIRLDTTDGLTFGGGKNRRIVLPFRAGSYNAEIRDLTLSTPEQANGGERIDITATMAGRLGPIKGVIAEGAGVILRWREEQGFEALPKPPSGVGVVIDCPPIRGGGYMRYREIEGDYGAIIDLQIGPIKATGMAIIDPDPFSFIVVIGVRFATAIELSFGFTLNGVGGLFAINRGFDKEALSKQLAAGAVSNLLFPDNPVAIAPTILDQISSIFPPSSDNALVLGPMLELGWGSQTGLVRAKLGLIIAFPEPALVLIGSLKVAVPPDLGGPKAKVIDLQIDMIASFSPFVMDIEGALINSKLGGIKVSGDMRARIDVGPQPVLALSAGGFYKGYTPPPKMGNMQRIKAELSPKIGTMSVEGYVALTSNSVQWGGKALFEADLEVAAISAGISIDALFQWAPYLCFVFEINVEITVKVFGSDFLTATFIGRLSGTTPWSLYGYAKVELPLLPDIEVKIGPTSWGKETAELQAAVDPVEEVAKALRLSSAMHSLLPVGSENLAILADRAGDTDGEQVVCHHPLAAFEVRQFTCPLEIEIERIGLAAVSRKRVYLAEPKINGEAAEAAYETTDSFPIGQFLNLDDQAQLARPAFETHPSGARIAASHGAQSGKEYVTNYLWETVIITDDNPRYSFTSVMSLNGSHIQQSAAVLIKNKLKQVNPYGNPTPVAPIIISDPALKQVRTNDSMALVDVGMGQTFMTASRAAEVVAEVGTGAQIFGMGSMR